MILLARSRALSSFSCDYKNFSNFQGVGKSEKRWIMQRRIFLNILRLILKYSNERWLLSSSVERANPVETAPHSRLQTLFFLPRTREIHMRYLFCVVHFPLSESQTDFYFKLITRIFMIRRDGQIWKCSLKKTIFLFASCLLIRWYAISLQVEWLAWRLGFRWWLEFIDIWVWTFWDT